MIATLFTLTEADRMVGFGLVCTEARYASVRWLSAGRLARCRVSAAQWKEIDRVLDGDNVTPGSIEKGSALATVLSCGRSGITTKWLTILLVGEPEPHAVAGELDRLLKSQALTGPLTPLREDDGEQQ